MSKTKIGIIGCGQISTIYAEAGGKFENLEIVACADLEVSRAQELAKKTGIPKALSVEELLKSKDVEIIVNLTIPAAHAEIATRALKAGKHVYNEKPLALRRREAKEMMALAREKELRIGCAPDTFLGGGLQTCRKLIDAGVIGEPVSAVGFMQSRGPESWHANPDFFYKKGAGPMFDMGPYYLTAFVYLLGPVRRVAGATRVTWAERTITSKPLFGKKIQVETPTHVTGLLDFESGPIGTLITSFDVHAHRLPNLEIYGSEASLVVPDPNSFGGPILLRKAGEQEWSELPLEFGYSENSRGIGLADMAAAIKGKREHRANDRLAYHVLDIMHTIHDSSECARHLDMKSSVARPQPLPLGLTPGKVEL